jgi:hypothetical protein
MSTGAKKGFAVLGAIVMIGAALGIRALLDGGDDGGSGNGEQTGPPRLLCATELAAACDDLASEHDIDVTIAPAGSAVEELLGTTDDQIDTLAYDGWLTFARDAEIVSSERERLALAPVLDEPSDPIGRTPLVLAAWKERADALAPRCGGELTWKCLGEVAGRPWTAVGGEAAWGTVKPGHADPATTGDGLAVIGQAASQYFGRSDLDRADVQDDPGFVDWFSRLERAVEADGDPLLRMLQTRAAAFDVVGTTEAQAGPQLAAAAADLRREVTLLYPSPVATADVVFAQVAGRDTDLDDIVTGDDGRGAIARAGYRVDDEGRAPGVPDRPALPKRSNLPPAGTLVALLQTWHEVTG